MIHHHTLKWTRLKDLDEIEKHKAGSQFPNTVNAQLSDNNRPKSLPKISLLSQVLNA